MENFSQSAPVNMAPTGIATFAKCPICPDIRQIQADIAVIGAPCDMAIQGRPCARLGPRGIRTQSTRFRFSPQGSYDPERDDYYLSTEKWSVMDWSSPRATGMEMEWSPPSTTGRQPRLRSRRTAASMLPKVCSRSPGT